MQRDEEAGKANAVHASVMRVPLGSIQKRTLLKPPRSYSRNETICAKASRRGIISARLGGMTRLSRRELPFS